MQCWQKHTRYYKAILCQDLFGDWVVVRVWGSLASRAGRIASSWVANEGEGEMALCKIAKRRLAHGYTDILKLQRCDKP